MAFDYGTQWIGVAVGQTITATATPLHPLRANQPTFLWQELNKIITEWKPKALVVGVPVYQDGLEEPITKAALRFARKLKVEFKLPVFGIDESLTSFLARQTLYEQGGSRLMAKYSIDSMAAKLILESWLKTY